MISLTFSGKNSKIILTALALSFTKLNSLKMMMHTMEDVIFGMRFHWFYLPKFLVLLPVGLHQSNFILVQQKGMERDKIWAVNLLRIRLLFTNQQS